MTKELFIKRMELIQNWNEELDVLGSLINKISDGHSVPTIGIELANEIIEMINEDLRIQDEGLLEWWLYEDVDKLIYEGIHGEKEIEVKTLEELYDYIVREKR